jgi:hypothetical protein
MLHFEVVSTLVAKSLRWQDKSRLSPEQMSFSNLLVLRSVFLAAAVEVEILFSIEHPQPSDRRSFPHTSRPIDYEP